MILRAIAFYIKAVIVYTVAVFLVGLLAALFIGR